MPKTLNRPAKIKTSEKNYDTYKSTSAAKIETLRRKSIRSEKYRSN